MVFAINTDGMDFTNLYNFIGGYSPAAALVLLGNTFYASTAGLRYHPGMGMVFALNTDGTAFTNLYNFTVFSEPEGAVYPFAGLILSGATLFGTVPGGNSGNAVFDDGSIFALNTNGTAFSTLHQFPSNFGEGNGNISRLILSNYTLYGTTMLLGASGKAPDGADAGVGSVFSLSFAPQLTLARSGAKIILSWPTNVSVFGTTGFNLQSTTNLATSVGWTNVSPSPSIDNGQNTVTNAIASAQMFYRLMQ